MKEYTFDTEMAITNLRNIKKVLELIKERRASVSCADDFLHSPNSVYVVSHSIRIPIFASQ